MGSELFANDAFGDRRSNLERHLHRIEVFEVALQNSFGLDLRVLRRRVDDRQIDGGAVSVKPFQYLPEVLPFIQPRVDQLERKQRSAFEAIKELAVDSFWQVYTDFQPLVHAIATDAGVDADQLGPVLARSILLFESSRGTKFVTYVEKCLREAVKNLRGQRFADLYGIPVSAGRLVHQISWQVQQAEIELGCGLSTEEFDRVVIGFLNEHSVRFSRMTIEKIAAVLRNGLPKQSIESCQKWLEPSTDVCFQVPGNDCQVDEQDEHRYQISQIHEAMRRAKFSQIEQAIVLERLGLAYQATVFEQVARRCTSATLRKRASRLLVRLMAARYQPQSPRFGWLMDETATSAKAELVETIAELVSSVPSEQSEFGMRGFVDDLLNWMSVSESVYRISISERGALCEYLFPDSGRAGKATNHLESNTFSKLRAALIEQERLDFPFWSM
ncbi:hypothetical protein [Rhodopirellula sp. MGV]|uniref:hypothetical protein n=1 Tax=Rhodopirellula sp. MGV TaxID=2023130 RepID=UPI000B96F9A0|nr:hypothetical protein [Rhodopirellula sp. MGV]OYP35452.1 hypothetical protein CGZ80_11460 [Rhodopirellula sp. MGV]PNY33892.1 hypothetical protein C2E31_26085 [Rhodopirellula baltica]